MMLMMTFGATVWAQSADLMLSSVIAPNPACGNLAQVITIRTMNAGPDDAMNFTITVTIDGVQAMGSPMVIPALTAGNFRDDNFIFNFPQPGKHLVLASITPGSPADPVPGNNSLAQLVDVQFNGTYTVGADMADHFSSIKMSIDTLNVYGVCGPTVISVDAGHTENNVNIALNATGTAVNTITIQAAGSPHPVIQSLAGGSGTIATASLYANGDAFIKINGGDYITIDGIDLKENFTGTGNALRMEYGYMINRAGINDGARNVSIRNCDIRLNRKYEYTMGIYQSNMNGSGATLNPASPAGVHDNLNYDLNTISNVYIGIYLRGYNASSPYDLYDQNTGIGTGGGNIITNFGGGGSNAYGIYAIYQDGLQIANDSINGGDSTNATLYGIFTSSGTESDADIYNNKVTVRSLATTSSVYAIGNTMGNSGTSNTVNIYNNRITNCTYTSATSGLVVGIFSNASVATLNIYNNRIFNISHPGTGSLTGISAGSPGVLNLYDNYIYNLEKTASGSLYGISSGTSAASISGNEVFNLSSTTGTQSIYGIYSNTNTQSEVYENNSVHDVTHYGSGNVFGIYLNSSPVSRICRSNNIYRLISQDGILTGINSATSPAHIHHNTIADLQCNTSSNSRTVSGIHLVSGNASRIYNNYVTELKAPYSSTVNGIRGINLTNPSADTVGVYYNTVYLDALNSGSTFSSAALYSNTTPLLDLRNNILVNVSEVNGTAYTSSFYRANSNLATYLNTSGNNCFYAGNPSNKNLIYADGTNYDQSIHDFIARVSPRDTNSFSELPPFLNTSSSPYDLHLNPSIPTKCESGALRITSPLAIDNDHDTDIRWGEAGYGGSGTAPDAGADEGDFAPLFNDLAVWDYISPTQHHCYTSAESITVQLVNTGRNDVQFSVTPVTLYATAFDGTTLQSFDTTLSSGILSPEMVAGLAIEITDQLDLHLPGTYQIRSWHNWAGDQVISNDTLKKQIISNNPEITGISAPQNTICLWDSVQLTASVFAYGGGASTVNFSRDTISPVPDPGTISSEIVVSGAGGSAAELIAVTIDSLMHSRAADIDLFIMAPDGSVAELSTDNGSGSPNYLHTVFRMDAATPVTTGAAPFTGNYLPEGDFATLTGNANGTWKLIVRDDNSTNSGTLFKWSLTLMNPNTITTCTWVPSTGLFPGNSPAPNASPANSTNYVLTVTDERGCTSDADSIYIFVNPSYRDTVDYEICDGDSLFAQGSWQYTPGYYTDNDLTVLGCDSITVWNLIVHPVYLDTIDRPICYLDSIWAGGAWQTAAGLYFDHLYSAFGCDSLVYSNVIVYPSYHDTLYPVICTGDSLWAEGAWQTTSGHYVDIFTTVLGCDSITHTYLTVQLLPVIDLGTDTLLCWDHEITLDAGNTGASYLWSNGDVTQTSLIDSSRYWLGSHFIWVEVDDGCVNTDTIMVSFSPCTGVEEDCITKMMIYPNPTEGIINISFDGQDDNMLMSVHTADGRLIMNARLEELRYMGDNYRIDLGSCTPGLYLLSVSNGSSSKTFPIIRK